MFTLTIQTNNAAFGVTTWETQEEIARILAAIISRINYGQKLGNCMDANGNKVGQWQLDCDNDSWLCPHCGERQLGGDQCEDCGEPKQEES